MEYFVVYLKCKRFFALPKHWIENPVVGQRSTVFFSGDASSAPDFNCEKNHYSDKNVGDCYDAFVYKSFDNYNNAKRFALNKRMIAPVQYQALEKFEFDPLPEPVDFLEISDSDTSNSNILVDVREYEMGVTSTRSNNDSDASSEYANENTGPNNVLNDNENAGFDSEESIDDDVAHSHEDGTLESQHAHEQSAAANADNNVDPSSSGVANGLNEMGGISTQFQHDFEATSEVKNDDNGLMTVPNDDGQAGFDSYNVQESTEVHVPHSEKDGSLGDLSTESQSSYEQSAAANAVNNADPGLSGVGDGINKMGGPSTQSKADSDASSEYANENTSPNNVQNDNEHDGFAHEQSAAANAVNNVDPSPSGVDNVALSKEYSTKQSESDTVESSVKIKLEKEIVMLRQSLKMLNDRIGDEIIDDSSFSSLEDEYEQLKNSVNTRHYQIDEQFAPKYYFITNSKGDRHYLNKDVKLPVFSVTVLKAMNAVYPKTSSDFDLEFLHSLLRAIFTKDELKRCASVSSLKQLNCCKLQFAKAIFRKRAGDDKNRFDAFRELAIEIVRAA